MGNREVGEGIRRKEDPKMEFLASTWFVWLVLAGVCYAYAILNQVKRFRYGLKNLWDFFDTGSMNASGLFQGVKSLVFAIIAAKICLVLAVVGIIANFI